MSVLYGFGQQQVNYTQYMNNTLAFNPAYAGTSGFFDVNTFYRAQWVGMDGAPRTFGVSSSMPLNDYRVGVGLSFYNDVLGPSNESGFSGDFSYSVYVARDLKMSLGFRAGINLLSVDFNQLQLNNGNDPIFANSLESELSPAIGAGVFLYHRSNWYLGLSAPNFIKTTRYDNNTAVVDRRASYYATGGYVTELSKIVKFKPALLVSVINGAPVSVDLSSNFMFNDFVVVGLSYRVSSALSALASIQLTENFLFGYSYDFDTTSIATYNGGTHELFLRFRVDNRLNCDCDPRRFY